MKFQNILDEILGHPVKIRVIRHLLQGVETRTARALASIAQVSQPAVLRPLRELVRQGILRKTVVGKSYIHQINRNNIIVAQGLIPLFRLESRLLDSFGEKLKKALPKKADTAVWFGSVARGTTGTDSDWDILVLYPKAKMVRKAREIVNDKVVEWSIQYSTRLDIQVRETKDFCRKFRRGYSFPKNVYEDYSHSQVSNPIFGESLTVLLGRQYG